MNRERTDSWSNHNLSARETSRWCIVDSVRIPKSIPAEEEAWLLQYDKRECDRRAPARWEFQLWLMSGGSCRGTSVGRRERRRVRRRGWLRAVPSPILINPGLILRPWPLLVGDPTPWSFQFNLVQGQEREERDKDYINKIYPYIK